MLKTHPKSRRLCCHQFHHRLRLLFLWRLWKEKWQRANTYPLLLPSRLLLIWSWKKQLISTGPAGDAPGIGLQIRVADIDGNGWKDIAVPGKSGTHILWNQGWNR